MHEKACVLEIFPCMHHPLQYKNIKNQSKTHSHIAPFCLICAQHKENGNSVSCKGICFKANGLIQFVILVEKWRRKVNCAQTSFVGKGEKVLEEETEPSKVHQVASEAAQTYLDQAEEDSTATRLYITKNWGVIMQENETML